MIQIPKNKTFKKELEGTIAIITVDGEAKGIMSVKKKYKEGATFQLNEDIDEISVEELDKKVREAVTNDPKFKKFIRGNVGIELMGIYEGEFEQLYKKEYKFNNGELSQ